MVENFEERIDEIQKIKDQFFPDLYFRNFKTGNPLVLSLGGREIKEIRFSLSVPGIISLGSLKIFEIGGDKEIDLASLAKVEQSSYHHKDSQVQLKFLNLFLEGQATNATVHTDPQAAPWVIVDLKKSYRIDRIVVNNCEGRAESNSWNLRIGVKDHEKEFIPVYDHPMRELEFAARIGGNNSNDPVFSKKYREALECLDMGTLLALRGEFRS